MGLKRILSAALKGFATSVSPQSGQIRYYAGTTVPIPKLAKGICPHCCAPMPKNSALCVGCISRNVRPKPPELPKSYTVEPIVAYRVWNLKDGRLKSCVKDFYWPFRKKLERDCIHSAGIHAVKGMGQVLSHGLSLADPTGCGTGLWSEYHADVVGSVYLWGEVIEHEIGYLAEFAYPKELFMPEDTDPLVVMQLEENYGVPVTLRKEFKKHGAADEQQSWATAALPLRHGRQIQFFNYAALYPPPTVGTAAASAAMRIQSFQQQQIQMLNLAQFQTQPMFLRPSQIMEFNGGGEIAPVLDTADWKKPDAIVKYEGGQVNGLQPQG